jgi:alpha-tubulin suppressor-like RCC1 family protein
LVLTDKGYLYSWGRGFEGQLGLSDSIELAMIPSYIKYFHQKHVVAVAAGAFYSLAITNDGAMYGWGEARMGQLGIGKHRDVRTPT